MSIIQKFFTFPPHLLRKIIKPENVINEVSVNLYSNLRDSSKQFIKGVINKDVDFIRQVTSKCLGDRLALELQEYKDKNIETEFHLEKYRFDDAEIFEISPYVIFGQDFKNRIQSQKYAENIRPLTSNRFIKFNPNLSFMQRLKQYQNKQIFGFNCLYLPLAVNVSEVQRNLMLKPFMVTFQTDSVKIDPYIVDCQGALFEDWRANGFK